MLQPLDCFEHLFDLISFSHAFAVLDVHARVALPGHPIDAMTGSTLSRFPEIVIAHPAQIRKTHALRIASHPSQKIVHASHK